MSSVKTTFVDMEPASIVRPCLGVSACLLGDRVRYDGARKYDSYVAETLARHFDLVPICPEVAIGLGVPRPPIQLEGDAARPRAVGVLDKRLDVTQQLASFARHAVRDFAPLCGYVFKSKSPSCGVEKVKVFDGGRARRIGRGLFAAELMRTLPLLPVIDELRLGEPSARDNFLERVFAYQRWQALHATGITRKGLQRFHHAHEQLLMTHSRSRCHALGKLLENPPPGGIRKLAEKYGHGFMGTLALPALRKNIRRS